jgi:hypothetical protein
MLPFDDFSQFQRLRKLWNSVRIERTVECGLFTFGDSDLPYYLITSSPEAQLVKIRRGNVTISRAELSPLTAFSRSFGISLRSWKKVRCCHSCCGDPPPSQICEW